MADQWFDISPIDHFWVRRRFGVFQTLAGSLLQSSRNIAEIGCGHGLVQRQIEEAYDRDVTGFDLNEFALERNQSQRSSVCCYDICQRAPQFHHRFDFIVMFDVLEHIDDEDHSSGRHVSFGAWRTSHSQRTGGPVAVFGVRSNGRPQAAILHSRTRAGCRAQRLRSCSLVLLGLAFGSGVVLRKIWLARSYGDTNAVAVGFDSRNKIINRMLGWLSGCEVVPQKLLGTSVMAVFRSPTSPNREA